MLWSVLRTQGRKAQPLFTHSPHPHARSARGAEQTHKVPPLHSLLCEGVRISNDDANLLNVRRDDIKPPHTLGESRGQQAVAAKR